MVTLPPLAVAAIPFAAALAATGLDICTGEEVLKVEEDTFSETDATTPFAIVPALRPQRTHLKLPVWFWHETDLPAWVAAVPAATLADEKSVGE